MGTKLPLLGMGKMFCRDTGWPFLFHRVEWPFGSISVLIAVTEPSARRCVSKIFWFIRDHICANYLNAAQAPRQKNVFWPIQNQHFAFHLAENPLQCTLRITHSQNLCITTFHCRLRCDAGVLWNTLGGCFFHDPKPSFSIDDISSLQWTHRTTFQRTHTTTAIAPIFPLTSFFPIVPKELYNGR